MRPSAMRATRPCFKPAGFARGTATRKRPDQSSNTRVLRLEAGGLSQTRRTYSLVPTRDIFFPKDIFFLSRENEAKQKDASKATAAKAGRTKTANTTKRTAVDWHYIM